jgi:hypothetical protein
MAKLLIRQPRLQHRINESLNWGRRPRRSDALCENCEDGYDIAVRPPCTNGALSPRCGRRRRSFSRVGARPLRTNGTPVRSIRTIAPPARRAHRPGGGGPTHRNERHARPIDPDHRAARPAKGGSRSRGTGLDRLHERHAHPIDPDQRATRPAAVSTCFVTVHFGAISAGKASALIACVVDHRRRKAGRPLYRPGEAVGWTGL